MSSATSQSTLARSAHARHCNHCLFGLPASQASLDASRMAICFYCIGSLDLLGLLDTGLSEASKEEWRAWIWRQHVVSKYGSGFRPGPFVTTVPATGEKRCATADRSTNEYDLPHIIMTYTALSSLGIIKDDFSRLDRPGLLKFLRSCQREDGSFSTIPQSTDSDLRTVYCAFAISSLLGDWSGIDVNRAVNYIQRCRTYEGGYGQSPYNEAQGGTTYTALAALYMAPHNAAGSSSPRLTASERAQTVRWLIQQQTDTGGFSGRTGKEADACYCFWCSASLEILGAGDLVDKAAITSFMDQCQFKFGGIAKAPGESSDPYHTYLSLAALALRSASPGSHASWELQPLDPILNVRKDIEQWARQKINITTRS